MNRPVVRENGLPPHRPASWQHGRGGEGPVAFFFRTPEGLQRRRGVYVLLTILSLPMLVPSFVVFLLLNLRYGVARVGPAGATIAHVIAAAILALPISYVAADAGLHDERLPLAVVAASCLPLVVRYIFRRSATKARRG